MVRTLIVGGALALTLACTSTTAPSADNKPVTATTIAPVDRGNLGVSPVTALFVPGQQESFAALPEQIFTRNTVAVTWTVDDPAVATVTADGQLTAVAPGFTWLRAVGTAGGAAHPIHVAATAPMEARGDYEVVDCTAPTWQACDFPSYGRHPLFLRYRLSQDTVIAEFWMGNDLTQSALVGRVDGSGLVRFENLAPVAPIISRGAGGCCSRLTAFTATVSGTRVIDGEVTQVGSSSTVRYHLLAPR